jgi:uncharacterized repeat protein (TIGR01451 family)
LALFTTSTAGAQEAKVSSVILGASAPSAASASKAAGDDDHLLPYVRVANPNPQPGPVQRGANAEVVPTTIETSGLNTPLRDVARVYQAYYHQSQLAGITAPTPIVGMRLRMIATSLGGVGSPDWPPAALNFAQYDVQLSRASPALRAAGEILSSATPFASNQDAATVVSTRSGALSIPAASFPNSPTSTPAAPNAFGSAIAFTTPYNYTPGDELVITIRHGGAVGGAVSNFFSNASFANNVADAVSATSGSAALVPTGFSSPLVIELVLGGNANADLSVVLSDSPDPVVAGQNLSYSAVVTNTGPDAATDVSVTLPLPAGTSFVSAAGGAGGSCTGSGPVTCTWAGSTANGATRTATMVVAIPATTAPSTVIFASANTTSTTTDPDPADNVSTTSSGVITQADLTVAVTDAPDPAIAGGPLSYTATLTNTGPSDAQNAAIEVVLPLEVTQGTVTPSAGGTCSGIGTITCTWAGTTPVAGTRSVVVATTVAAAVPQGATIEAEAQASSATADPVPANNNALTTTTVNAAADLAISLTDSPDPVVAGTQLSYVATLSNAGLSDAQGATITLPVPSGTSFVSAAASSGGSCSSAGSVVCTWPGATTTSDTRTATIVVLVAPAQVAGLSATATASATTSDPVNANDNATVGTAVQVQADLAVTLTDAPDPVAAGGQLTYTALVSNTGPSDATGVVLNLPTPAGTSFVSGSVSGGGSCAAGISCTIIGSMAPGSTRTVTVIVLVGGGVLDGTVINATASLTSTSPDPNLANNSASTSTTVSSRADLVINLTASASQVLVNVPVTFVATSLNNGPSDAQNLSITVTLTPDFRYSGHVATGATCSTPQLGTTGTIVCTWAGATAAGQTRTLEVIAFSNSEGNTAVNASTTSDTPDPVANNNAGSVSVVVGFPFTAIPALGGYALILMGLLLGMLGLVAVRRQN